MASAACSPMKSSILCKCKAISLVGPSSFPLHLPRAKDIYQLNRNSVFSERLLLKGSSHFLGNGDVVLKKVASIPKSNISSNSSGTGDESSNKDKTPFGYTRKDVLLIGVGVTIIGVGLKSGLEFFGVDPLQAGNVVQLVVVLGLTVGWISTYIFRVSNKDMTYTKQLRDYENKVMEKRLESLTEAELQALLEQVEEEKTRLGKGEQGK